jgi:hypothetical protein
MCVRANIKAFADNLGKRARVLQGMPLPRSPEPS